MAVATIDRPAGRTHGRGRPDRVTIRRTTLIEGLLEGMALAQDALGAAERIQTYAAAGSRQLIAQEAGRLGYRATKANAEFRRLIADVEEPL